MNIYLTKKDQEVLKAILRQEQTSQTSTWEVNGERNFIDVDILLMKLTKNWFNSKGNK
jgi:hypothetical protein|tara:strand:- start:251 stop:424 length:174 start_codon:yes stop_codon:yes gene_type:complete